MLSGLFGKYRAIVISVAMFIFLDAGVLVLNFYISSQIAEDASNVNLAGRQRMLSQKMVKSALDYQLSLSSGAPSEAAYNELIGAVDLFDKTLSAFHEGGTTKDGIGQDFYLNAATTPAAIESINVALAVWAPLQSEVKKLIRLHTAGVDPSPVLTGLTQYAKANNLELLRLMNDLTNELESIARDKSETLRFIQATAITLAVLNFFLILFHFIGQLRHSDAQAEEARKETTEILKTVREGLLLIDDQLVIGTQYSESIQSIFGAQDYAGMSFRDLLKSVIVESDMQTAEEYIKLLLNSSVKESLVGSLNPLSDVEVSLPDGSGGFDVKHLSFRFNRTIENQQIRHILVTVLDVTELVELRRELEIASQNNGFQLTALKELLHIDRDSLQVFLSEANSALMAVNDILKQRANSHADYRDKVDSAFRIMHRLKGDASALDLPHVVQAAHEFENELDKLSAAQNLQGGDFLALTLALNEFLKLLADLEDIVATFDTSPTPQPDIKSERGLDKHMLFQLAERIAEEQNKKVSLTFDDAAFARLEIGHRKVVQDCIVQLVRNAIVHGIETMDERQTAGKSTEGSVHVAAVEEDGQVKVSVRDDGRGISIEGVREQALKRGMYSKDELEAMQPNRLMSLIFEPGFSTKDSVDEHSGRGIGMDIVKAIIQDLKGRLRISNRPTRSCEISLLLPVTEVEATLSEAV